MESPATPEDALPSRLAEVRAKLRDGLFLAALGGVAALALTVFALAGLSDYLVGWEVPARSILVAGLALIVLLAVGLAWRRASATPLAEAARRADRAGGDPRRSIGAALDLAGTEGRAPGSLGAHLASLASAEAGRRLDLLNGKDLVPARERRRPWRGALWAMIALALLLALHPRAGGTVAGRLLRPWSDLPPYSPYRFALVGDAPPQAVYGKDAALAAEISGPAPTLPVELLVRPARGGEAERLPTFREGGVRYARRLEGVTEPLEFAFAVGRARSAWHRLEVLYQPRLEEATVEIAPPAYARLSPSRFKLGAEDLRALKGSSATLVAASNRPLSGGVLEGRAPQGGEVLRRIEGRPLDGDDRRVEFLWRVEEDLVWTLDLVDVGGGRMESPVPVVQHLVPDEKPAVSLVEPGPFVMATPSSEVRFVWDVTDDLGLDRLDLVRSAEKFRERSLPLEGGAGEKTHRVETAAKLGGLGALPGQTLAYLLEARDRNPDMLGVGASTEARVQVISEEEYGAQIRLRTTLEEFSARYRVLREQLARTLEALEAMAEAAAAGGPAFDAARLDAARAHREAIGWFEAFAQDFPAYATDPALNELSGGLRDELEANLAQIEGLGSGLSPEAAASLAAGLRDRLQPGRERLDAEGALAERLASIGAVMEMAAELEAIHEEQRSLSERLGRLSREIALGLTGSRGELPGLRARQERNRDRLERVRRELPERLSSLPDEAASLREGAEKVLEQLGTLEVATQMTDSVEQAGEGKVPGSAASAALALANLDQILAKERNDFCDICRGGMPGLCAGEGVAALALAQMLEALRGRSRSAGQGQGDGAGGGSAMSLGARGGSGSAMRGIQLDIPLVGPPRVSLDSPPSGMGGSAQNRGGAPAASPGATEEGTLPAGEAAAPGTRSWNPESVPPQYREAVGRFFSEQPGAPSSEAKSETP